MEHENFGIETYLKVFKELSEYVKYDGNEYYLSKLEEFLLKEEEFKKQYNISTYINIEKELSDIKCYLKEYHNHYYNVDETIKRDNNLTISFYFENIIISLDSINRAIMFGKHFNSLESIQKIYKEYTEFYEKLYQLNAVIAIVRKDKKRKSDFLLAITLMGMTSAYEVFCKYMLLELIKSRKSFSIDDNTILESLKKVFPNFSIKKYSNIDTLEFEEHFHKHTFNRARDIFKLLNKFFSSNDEKLNRQTIKFFIKWSNEVINMRNNFVHYGGRRKSENITLDLNYLGDVFYLFDYTATFFTKMVENKLNQNTTAIFNYLVDNINEIDKNIKKLRELTK